jgi:signal peptidase I
MNRKDDRSSATRTTEPSSSNASAGSGRQKTSGFNLNWFTSKSVRQGTAMRKHVQKLLNHQRDLLRPQFVQQIEAVLAETDAVLHQKPDPDAISKQMDKLEKVATERLKPYPSAAWRENIEVLLVALAVAMGIRTFFLQPFKIPTGSMQPTLYGVTSENLINKPDARIPTGWERVRQWFEGVSYIHVVTKNDGELESVSEPVKILIFNIRQTLVIGGEKHDIWFPPDYGTMPLQTYARAGLVRGTVYHRGDDVVKLRVVAGDHLFVDRVSFNFRPPHRGEIIVFDTHGITNLPLDQQNTFYIKRLIGLGGDTLTIKKDHLLIGSPQGDVPVGHIVVNGTPISAASPHFQNLYSFDGANAHQEVVPYKDNHYFGHGMLEGLAPGREFHVSPGNYFVMGDNTMNSSDSRYWGEFSQEKVIGKSFFVYWPLTERFGWGYNR